MAESGKKLLDRWLELLRAEGYLPTVELVPASPELSYVAFKVEGTNRVLVLDEDDPSFANLVMTWTLGADLPRPGVLLEVANELNRELKALKVVIDLPHELVHFTVETISDALPDSAAFQRMLLVGSAAAAQFFERARAAARRTVA